MPPEATGEERERFVDDKDAVKAAGEGDDDEEDEDDAEDDEEDDEEEDEGEAEEGLVPRLLSEEKQGSLRSESKELDCVRKRMKDGDEVMGLGFPTILGLGGACL